MIYKKIINFKHILRRKALPNWFNIWNNLKYVAERETSPSAGEEKINNKEYCIYRKRKLIYDLDC